MIEAVGSIFEILRWAVGKNATCTLYHCALGGVDTPPNKWVNMRVPYVKNLIRPALSRVVNETPQNNECAKYEKVQLLRGSELLGALARINYIKCDIEEYEEFVLPDLAPLIAKHRPFLQIETWGVRHSVVFPLMASMHYERYSFLGARLVKNLPDAQCAGDFLFVPAEKEVDFIARINGDK